MDASRTLIAKNNKGAVVIFTALVLMLVVSAILLIAVDFSFMYVNKSKLQNAADAGALAGAGNIKHSTFTINTTLNSISRARISARQFALENFNLPGMVLNDSSNSAEGDIVVGTWNPDATPKFTVATLSTYSSVNAVKVVTRRTGETGTGIGASTQFPLFFGNFFGNIFGYTDKGAMGTKATAIAWRPPKATTYLMVGYSVCNPTSPITFPYEISMDNNNMGWTSLLNPVTTAVGVKTLYFCPADKIPNVEVCGKSLFTSGGTDATVFEAVESDFYNPDYDRSNKTFNSDGSVATWEVIVPVAGLKDPSMPYNPVTNPWINNPALQPNAISVWGYAKIVMTSACGAAGGGSPCGGGVTTWSGPCPVNPINFKKKIFVSNISCVTCANRFSLIGAKPVLAQ